MTWLKKGAHILVHGVSDDYIGEIVELLPGRVVMLSGAAWVSESGRLGEFVSTGKADGMEIEVIGDHCVHWEAITNWPHPLITRTV